MGSLSQARAGDVIGLSVCQVEVYSNLTSGSGLLSVRIELFIATLTLEELGSKDPT